jgi:hypothetical protein
LIDLGRSRPFQQSIVAIYWVALPLFLLSGIGIALSELRGRWSMAAGLIVGAAFIGWRLWLYRRALGVATDVPPAHRVGLVWLPLGLLAFAGFSIAMTGLMFLAMPWFLISDGVAKAALGGRAGTLLISGFGLIPVAIGVGLIAPFVLALKRQRAAREVLEAFEDEDPQGQGAPPA